MNTCWVAPSILSADFARLAEEVHDVAAAGADWLHVDVMDGHFVPNLTLGPAVVKSLRKVTHLPLDVHLMVENPERWVEPFAQAGADVLTIHLEATPEPLPLLRRIRALGIKAGVTLRPATDVNLLRPLLADVDLVLVMSVEPGFGGQAFLEEQGTKLETLRSWVGKPGPGRPLLEIDGGVNIQTASKCRAADVLVAGSAVFGTPDRRGAINDLRKAWAEG